MEELHLQRKNGYKNYSELSSDDIDKIVKVYFENNLSIKEIEEKFKLTKRTMPKIFKIRNINSRIKNRYTLNSCAPNIKYIKTTSNKSIIPLYNYLYQDATIFLKRKRDIFQRAIGYVNRKLLNR